MAVEEWQRLLRSAGSLHRLELSVLELELLSRLMDGRRTRNELVEEIYHLHRGEPGFVASYTKIRRGLEDLESRGFVSHPPFGKEKPYRITSYAMQRVASTSPDVRKPRLVERADPIIYAACLISGLATFHVVQAVPDPTRIFAILPASFFVLVGFSLARIWDTIRKVSY